MENEKLNTENIYKGCTRPAMLFGVPITPFVLGVGGSFVFLFVLLSPPWSLLSILVWYVMRMMCKEDDQRFTQLGISLLTKANSPNFSFWRAASFQPVEYRKGNNKK